MVNATDAALGMAKLDKSRWIQCVLARANCGGASWTASSLDSCDLSHALLDDGDFSLARFKTVNLHAISDARARWDSAKLIGVLRTDSKLLAAETWRAKI
jgi:uncharacterized protein YjbI with pentapeptide repeats